MVAIPSLLLLLVPLSCSSSPLDVSIAASFITDSDQYVHFEIVKPALDLAIQEANRRYDQIRFNLVLRNDSDSCPMTLAAGLVAEAYHTKSVYAIFGPACDYALDQVARMAGYWNIPIFTAGGMSIDFTNKEIYPTLTRLSFSLDRVSHFLIQVMREHEWHNVAALVYEADPLMLLSLKSIGAVIEREKEEDEYDLKISEFLIKPAAGKNISVSIQEVLKDASRSARIILLLVPKNLVREILLHAMDLGFNREEYAFIGVDLIKKGADENDIGWYKMGSRRNNDAKLMYQALMLISVRVPVSDEFESFAAATAKQATLLSQKRHKYVKSDVNPIIAGFYDAILLYAQALNKTIRENGDPRNASSVLRHIWGQTLSDVGLTGDIVINENGDREADYTLNDFDHETGLMVPVGTYFGALKSFRKLHGMEIQWPGAKNQPPPDMPLCGFDGKDEKCMVKSNLVTILVSVLISMLSIAAVAGFIGYFVFRKFQSEKNINDMWWKLDQSEIEIMEGKKNTANKSVTSLMSAFSGMSGTKSNKSGTRTNYSSTTINLSGIDIAMFRGQKVAVKEIDLSSKFLVTRDVLMEMSSMREVQLHDNVVKFYGMTVDEPVRIVNELCLRGSLRDVIENESIEMDWLFRYSILTDVAEGMHYLHNSPIVYHGHLKSTNLLIDGRFTVKIADYGLRCVREKAKTSDFTNPRNLFWTAPEHLRARDPLRSGSPAGDVYSFAIICQEVIVRQGPFEMSPERRAIYSAGQRQLDPDEILDKVRIGGIVPYRPDIGAEDCVECPELLSLVKSCWSEVPQDRPSFGRVKLTLKKITKGKSSKWNLFLRFVVSFAMACRVSLFCYFPHVSLFFISPIVR
jgi:atrial natriuretic peptide receptor A